MGRRLERELCNKNMQVDVKTYGFMEVVASMISSRAVG